MKKIAMVGVGNTKVGEWYERDLRDLTDEAIAKALSSTNIDPKEIGATFVGSMSSGLFNQQEHLSALIGPYSGVKAPALRVESACASGGNAFRVAMMALHAGYCDTALVVGVEKMTDLIDISDVTTALGTAADGEWELGAGATFPALFALMMRAHMHKYGSTLEEFASIAVKNHHNGALNPDAQFQRPISMETVMNSRVIADPLRLFDCSPISDGAAAVILTREDLAKKYTDDPIYVTGSGAGTDVIALHNRKEITTLESVRKATETAFKMAKIQPKDVGLVEVHDCFTIAEAVALEDMGFCKKGQGGKISLEGETALNSTISVNPSGGLKAKGHPVGATGIYQTIEIFHQLRNEAGKRQVTNNKIGVTQNIGGSGATCVVNVFSRGD
ncbi:thiolase domain-containing protein [Candidatus Heimdallarchaeota archaeon]|nr:MAG: thiolase domain-containing protein [Candidatus Gerdarchaeota archaeon]RLI72499.1 MAG: thiolase domain-containing protein [Candidatus Gerdarchaeota archaeon]RLI74510.1 MAG: thiolase domain-containing protein [Candidatus Heimdallarchaeota archaeon]